jgi:myo-inositol-1(or 4)-monophosphatase
MVARGALDAYWEIGIHCWDIAAGALIVEEAGGITVDGGGWYSTTAATAAVPLSTPAPLDLLGRKILAIRGEASGRVETRPHPSERIAIEMLSLIEDIPQERD